MNDKPRYTRWVGGMAEVYWRALQRYIVTARQQADSERQRQDIAVCLTLAVATVETFLNTYARIVANRVKDPVMLAEVNRRRPLEHKMEKWPALFLGKPLPQDGEAYRDFYSLKERRNRLMHFHGELWSLNFGEQSQPMIDSSEYDSLVIADADQAARAARAFMFELLLIGASDRRSAEWQLHQIAPE